jgi:hypothetical protein
MAEDRGISADSPEPKGAVSKGYWRSISSAAVLIISVWPPISKDRVKKKVSR